MTSDNLNRIGNTSEPQTKSLAEIMESFMGAFTKLWWISIVLMILAGMLGYFKYKSDYVAMYQSEVTFSITSPEYDGPDETYTDNTQLASTLSVSFDYLINNEVFYEIIQKDLGLNYVPSIITVSAVPNTNILSIIALGKNPELNNKVIDSIINNYSEVVEFVLGETKLTILEQPMGSDEAINAYEPTKAIIKYGFIGFILGLLPSVAYAFFVRTIKSKEDIEKYLSVTCFGILPVVNVNRKEKNASCSILDKKIGFRYLEAMRTITSRCERELEKNQCKVILITSTQENEGKSTFAMNLSYSLSKLQKKVMLIDGDLRKPELRNKINSELIRADLEDYSMEQFLNREVKSNRAIANIKDTRVILLAPNKPAKNTVDCLNSSSMENFIKEGRDVVDYIIIDAPPCSGISDAAVLAKYSDGVIYVVKEDTAKVNKILDTIEEFSYTRIPIIGCILNGSVGRLKLSYGYGKYGGYGYGKRYGGYGYGYGSYGGYGYGEYGEVSDKEFRTKPRKVSKHIALETTEEQKKALEAERQNKKDEL